MTTKIKIVSGNARNFTTELEAALADGWSVVNINTVAASGLSALWHVAYLARTVDN